MPRGKKKKFIDKKHSVTFYLAHRSQRDPLIADETAPQHVLVPIEQAGGAAGPSTLKYSARDPETRKEEQKKYGVYFDDDYDYLQHLKNCRDVTDPDVEVERIPAPSVKHVEEVKKKEELTGVKLQLPSSVFESEFEEDVGLLNKAAPSRGFRPDLDPDVVAALDEDFNHEDPENMLEDNFMELANTGDTTDFNPNRELTEEEMEGLFSSDDEDAGEWESTDDGGSEGDDTIASLEGPQYSFRDEETKSHFTNYSMSSSVVRRNKQLLLVDERFEKMFEDYEDTEIGPLDCEDIEGHMDPQSDLLLKYADEFEQDRKKEELLNEKVAQIAINATVEESESSELTDTDEDEMKEKWDCESILSTYSTTKNRPRLIKVPSKKNPIIISGKTGMPTDVFGKGLTAANLKHLNKQSGSDEEESGMSKSVISKGSSFIRPLNETPEERLERKRMVKEYRKERRLEKKANTEAFKEEKKRQEKVRLNSKANIQGLKLCS